MSGDLLEIRRRAPFTIVPNSVWTDERISFKAKGLLGYLLSKPDTWRPLLDDLEKVGPDGREAARTGMQELMAAGYLTRYRVRCEGGRFKTISVVWETPLDPVPADDGQGYTLGEYPSDDPDRSRETRRPVNPEAGSNRRHSKDLAVTTEEQGRSSKKEVELPSSRTSRGDRRPSRPGPTSDSAPDSQGEALAALYGGATHTGEPKKRLKRPPGPDSASGLANYWATVIGGVSERARGSSRARLGKHAADLMRSRGVTAAEYRAMVDLYRHDSWAMEMADDPAGFFQTVPTVNALLDKVRAPQNSSGGESDDEFFARLREEQGF